MKQKKILIFITRYLCYASNCIFALKLSGELKKLGATVEVCSLMDEEDAGLIATKFIGKSFDAIIDFNSTMPRAMAGDVRFLDEIDGPFYNYIVDHPLYHHPILKLPIKNFNVICLDPDHKSYIEKYYPNIKNVIVLPLAGTKALTNMEFRRRQKGVLFAGTYYDPQKYKDMMEAKGPYLAQEYKTMAEILVEKPWLRPEEAFEEMGELLGHDKKDLDFESYRQELNGAYVAEIYARAINRSRIITEFIKNDVPLIICGNEWEYYEVPDNKQVRFLDGIDYGQSMELIASCQMLLNIMPGFRRTAHDRVFSAMINNTVLLSDSNDYMEKTFQDGEDCILFSYNNLAETSERLKIMLNQESELERIADSGRQKASEVHSWSSRARMLYELLFS